MTAYPCPACHRLNDCHDDTSGGGAEPTPGALSICWACAAPAVFATHPLASGLVLRSPTEAEMREIQQDPRVTAALDAMAAEATPQAAIRRTRGAAS